MAKLKITKEQYNRILIREQQARLKASGDILNENLSTNPELLEEGWKEVVLGVAMMMGVGLSGQNKAMAQDAVKNEKTMAQIKATLEDESKIEELSGKLEEKGMKNADEKLVDNAEHVMDQFNEIAKNNNIKYRVNTKVVTNLQQLKGALSQGYALKKADVTSDTIKTPEATHVVQIQDTIDVEFGSDNMFVTGGFTLNQGGKDTINSAVDGVIKMGGKIISIDIESSTDAEPIPKFKTESDKSGNIKLAELRTKSVADLLASLSNNAPMTHREIPNNGSDVVSSREFIKYANSPKNLNSLRDKTTEFRYVKIKMVAVFESDSPAPTTDAITKVVKSYRFELVKIIEGTGTVHKIKTKTHFKNKKFKCKKPKGNNNLVKCSFQH